MKNTVIDPETGCWNWRGWRDDKGYGRITVGKTSERVHRLGYRMMVGPIPAGLTLDHLCRNTGCWNPDHLEPVTMSENSRRAQFAKNGNREKTHCPKNHPYDAENTYWRKDGARSCKQCGRESTRRWQEKKAASKLLDPR